MRKIDLHTHSFFSDGSMSPTELLFHAKEVGLSALALTDHDTVAGIPEAERAAKENGIEFVPGVEFSTEGISQVHILGYYIDSSDTSLTEAFRLQQEEESSRLYEGFVRTRLSHDRGGSAGSGSFRRNRQSALRPGDGE